MNSELSLFQYPLGIRLLIMVATVIVTSWCALRGIHFGLLMCVISGIGIFELINPSGLLPILSIDRIVWPIVVGFFIWRRQRHETERLPLDAVEWSMLAFVAAALVSFLVHGLSPSQVHGRARFEISPLLRGIIMPYAAYAVARRAVRTPAQVQSFLKGLAGVGVYLTIVGVGESWGPSWMVFPRYILSPTAGIHVGQARGIFLNASFLGVALAMALPILIWLFFTDRGRCVWLWPLIGLVSAVPLAYTVQRAAWLGAACAVLVLALSWPRRRSVLILVLVGGAAAAFFFVSGELAKRMENKVTDAGSVDYRILLLKASWRMIQDNPLVGVGFNRFKEEAFRYSALLTQEEIYSHNSLMTILSELGLVGFIPYLAVFVFLFLKSWKLYVSTPRYRGILGALWGVSSAFIIMMLAIEIRIVLYPNALFFCLWGMIPQVVQRLTGEDSLNFHEPVSHQMNAGRSAYEVPTPIYR